MVMKIKKEYLLLAIILLIGVVARIIKFDDPDLVMDTVAYSRLGKNLIESGKYVFGENYNVGVFFPPVYPVLIGLVNLLIDDLFVSAKMVSFVLSCFTIFLAYLTGKELYNKEAGLFAALVFAIYPTILIVSVQGYSDAPFFFFLLLSIYLFIVALKRNNAVIYSLLGVLFAMAYLNRPEGLFLVLLPVMQLFGVFNNTLHINKKYILRTIILILLFTLTISPYMVFVKNYTGEFSLSGKGNISLLLGELSGREYHKIVNAPDNLYDRAAFALTEDKTQLMGWNRKTNLSLKEYILKDPVNFLSRYQRNMLLEIYTLNKLLIPIILPLFFSFFYRDLFMNRMKLIFLLFPLLFFFMYPLFIVIEKQMLLIVVFLIVVSAGGFANSQSVISDLETYYGIKKNRILKLLGKSIKYIIIVILILSSLSYLKYSRFESFDPNPKPEEHKRAGYYLKKTLLPEYEELNIMGQRPYVSFYSDSRFTMLPYANGADVIYFAKLYHVDYIVIDERTLSKWDYYDELLEMHRYSNDVELVYEDNSDRLIKLFKVKN